MNIICDIDGTLANGAHRQHYLNLPKKDWATYRSLAHLDTVHEHVANLVRLLYWTGHKIIICTGRGTQEKDVTEAWLKKHGIFYHDLRMRREGDYRSDDVIKAEQLDYILEKYYKIDFVLDDRDRVVKMWRSKNIPCFQVAPGDF